MKLVVVLSLILASIIVEGRSQYGLFQQFVAIPANGNKIVRFQVTYPPNVSFKLGKYQNAIQ